MYCRVNRVLRVAVVVVLAVCAVSRAEVYYVAQDGDNTTGQSWATAFTSIQDALDSAFVTAGDQIQVKQGTYTIASSITVGKAVAIYAGYSGDGNTRDPQAYITTVDGAAAVIHCLHISADATIDGLTISGGYSTGTVPNDEGGGMYIDNCDPTINNCTFQNNHADYRGGAICVNFCDAGVISNCTFVNNTSGSYGGALHNYDSDITITDCTFTANQGLSGSSTRGGAISNNQSAATITGCTFTGNKATSGAGIYLSESDAVISDCTFADCDPTSNNGGGLYTYKSSATIRQCAFYGNSVTSSGGAIYDGGGASGTPSENTVVNCILLDNYAGVYGGAVYSDRYLISKFTNCTLYGNNADNKGGAVFNSYGEPTFGNCIIWGNTAPTGPGIFNFLTTTGFLTFANYSDVQEGYTGTGNIVAEPNFADAGNGDFQLTAGSDCIDTGDNAAPGVPAVDYAGDPRPVDGDGDATPTVDMGAYEYQGAGPIASHVDEIDIWQGRAYDNPTDMTPSYVFILDVETDNTVDHIEFLTPAGQAFTIPNDPCTVSGDIETYHDDWGTDHGWEYWGEFSTAEALADYGDGTYTVTIHYSDASTHQTDVWYGVPGTSEPLAQPTQKPVLTAPAYEGSVASPVTLTWEACTDPNASTIYLAIYDPNTDTDVANADIAVSATESDPYSMPEGVYRVELAFENYYSVTNVDGIPFEYGKASHLESEFEALYTTVFRFWSPVTGRHFYTASQNEKDKLIDSYSHVWTFEGPVFKACATAYYPNLAEVHRFWSDSSKAHFYTISESERNKLIDNFSHVWTHEGAVLYAYPEGQQAAEAKPVYRFWKGADNTHFFTMSESEKDKLIDNFSHVYTFEGIAFYAYE